MYIYVYIYIYIYLLCYRAPACRGAWSAPASSARPGTAGAIDIRQSSN